MDASTLQRAVLLLCLLSGVLFSSEVQADARLEAKRHFRKGMALIADGQYQAGIDELEQAYAIRPHPNVLFNIARAYDDSGASDTALDFYRRYLETQPKDASAVISRVEALERARATAAKAAQPVSPQQAPAPHRSGGRDAGTERANRRVAELEQKLDAALAEIEALRQAKAEREKAEEEAAPSPPDSAVPDLPVSSPHASMSPETEPYAESVVTASRRAQSAAEAPNATTIITAEEIRLSGARSLPELLRRVPGAEVMQMGVGSANLSFRGFQQRVANKVLVLIDGRTEYQDFLGATIWSSLPIGLEDIERVEVVRGPGSALYGANAMLGVINIITRTPQSDVPAELNAFVGMGSSTGVSGFGSDGKGRLQVRASAGYEQADKWSRDYADGRPDVAAVQQDTSLGLRSARGFVRGSYQFSESLRANFGAGVNRLYTEVYPLGLLRNYELDGLVGHARGDLEAGAFKLRAFWNHLKADIGPQYEPLGQRSLRASLSSHVFDAESSWTNEARFWGTHRFELGSSIRLKRVSWPAYLGFLQQELHWAFFLQDEWTLAKPFRIVASYRIDRHPLLDGGTPGFAQSPRLSALYAVTPEHVFRATAATAFRQPTFLESYLDIRVPVPGVNGASALTQGSRSLEPESLVAYELGYRGGDAELGVEWDLALYQNEIRRLISISGLQPLPASASFDPATQTHLLGRSVMQNERGSYTARGLEVGATFSPVDRVTLRSSVALQRIAGGGLETGEVCAPCTQSADMKLFGGVTYRAPSGFDFDFSGAYAGPTTWIEREPDPGNPTRIVSLSNPLPGYVSIGARIAYRMLQDSVTLALSGNQLAGRHAEHPFGNLVERRVFITLSVRP